MKNKYDQLKALWHTNSFSKYISFDEAISKASCARNGIDYLSNIPDANQYKNLVETAKAFEKLRIAWGRPINITTALRGSVLNRKIGGSQTSAHLFGGALDITCGDKSLNDELAELAISLGKSGQIKYDQFILENPTPDFSFVWFHFGILRDYSNTQRMQIMIAKPDSSGRMKYMPITPELASKYRINI